jgi:hypothetical protein
MVLDELTKPRVGLSANDNRVTGIGLGRFKKVPNDILPSYRDGKEVLFARGIIVTYESIRQWGQKFGQQFANH